LRLEIKKNLKKIFGMFHFPKHQTKGVGVPKEWLQGQAFPATELQQTKKALPQPTVPKGFVIVDKAKQPWKFHLPHFLTIKRTIAGFLMLFDFILAIVTLTSATGFFALIFLLNTYLLADYLWKTARKKQV
jgi:hypothetical protein